MLSNVHVLALNSPRRALKNIFSGLESPWKSLEFCPAKGVMNPGATFITNLTPKRATLLTNLGGMFMWPGHNLSIGDAVLQVKVSSPSMENVVLPTIQGCPDTLQYPAVCRSRRDILHDAILEVLVITRLPADVGPTETMWRHESHDTECPGSWYLAQQQLRAIKSSHGTAEF
jgi:hypothetical protein